MPGRQQSEKHHLWGLDSLAVLLGYQLVHTTENNCGGLRTMEVFFSTRGTLPETLAILLGYQLVPTTENYGGGLRTTEVFFPHVALYQKPWLYSLDTNSYIQQRIMAADYERQRSIFGTWHSSRNLDCTPWIPTRTYYTELW